MTGLEALERVKKSHHVAMTCLDVKKDTETLEALNTIEKHIKVGEILKRYFKKVLGIYVDSEGSIFIYVPCETYYFIKITREEAEIIRDTIGGDVEVCDTSGLEEKCKTLEEFLK